MAPSIDSEVERVASFRTQLRRFLRKTEAAASQAGLTSERYDLLLMIRASDRNGEGIRMTELHELLQLQQTAVSELVKRTEQAGLIDRRPSRSDGRSWLLRLTPEGERRLIEVFDSLREDRGQLSAVFQELDILFRATSD